MKWSVLLVASLAAAAPVDKRDTNWAALLGLTTEAPAPPPAPTTKGFLANLLDPNTTPAAPAPAAPSPTKGALGNLWDALKGETVAAVSTAAAAPAPAATAAAAPAPAATSQGLWASLLNAFGGSSKAPAAAPAAAPAPATSAPALTSGGWLSKIFGLFSPKTAAGPVTSTPTSEGTVTAYVTVTPTLKATGLLGALSGLAGSSGAGSSGSSGSSSSGSGSNGNGVGTGVEVTYGNIPTSLAPSSSQSSSSSGSNGLFSSISSGGNTNSGQVGYAEMGAGITYSPYTKSGSCKSASQVAADLAKLSAFGIIRLYNVDCLGIQNVAQSLGSHQKMFLGLWSITNIANDMSSLKEQVLSGLRGWLAVHTIAIGNELVNSGGATVAQISSAVQEARSWLKSNAPLYLGYVVSVDTLAATLQHQEMCGISDYIAVNCHPYFSAVEASTSGTWLKAQVAQLQSFCGNGKQILVTESGWPSQGQTLGAAVPSLNDQYAAIKSLGEVMGPQVIMFTTYNDYWKAPGPYGVEQHWGVFGDPSV